MKHIDEFTIHRFRGMREAKLTGLGQINLLVGGNNSGKTSVLEALSLFGAPLNPRTWSDVASAREISSSGLVFGLRLLERILWLFPQEELFPQKGNADAKILFSASGTLPLKNVLARYERYAEVIKVNVPAPVVNEDIDRRADFSYEEIEREVEGVRVEINVLLKNDNLQEESLTAIHKFRERGILPRRNTQEVSELPIRSIHGCSHRSNTVSSELWTDVIYADAKLQTVKLLQLFDPDIQDVDIVSHRERGTSISIKHKKLGRAPLSAFGDGLRRVFTLASAIIGAKDGLLLIDELEIAVHTRMLEKTFNWLAEFCGQYNVQLFATTHSLEAIDAVIEACKGKDIDLVAYRLQKDEVQTTAKRFDKQYLEQLREELGVDLRW